VRDDQYAKLQGLSEKLTDVVVVELEPDAWPGAGKLLQDLSRDERGDRYWCKKNAAATLSLLTKMQSLLGIIERRAPDTPAAEEHDDLDDEIKAAEKAATKILKDVQARVYERKG
jgi:hypothetical protein